VVAARPISRPTSLLFLPLSTPGSTPPASQGSRSTPTGKQHSFFDEVLLLLLRPSLVAPLLPSLPCSVVEPGHLHGGGAPGCSHGGWMAVACATAPWHRNGCTWEVESCGGGVRRKESIPCLPSILCPGLLLCRPLPSIMESP
jgi:hypothetical protein